MSERIQPKFKFPSYTHKTYNKKNIRYSSLDHSKNCAPNWAVIIKDTQTIANQHNNISNNNIGNNNNKKIRKRLKFLCGNEKWYLLRAG